MKTTLQYHFTDQDAMLLRSLRESESLLANFREAAESSMLGRGDEAPRSGWNAVIRGGCFDFDQFLHACEYLHELIRHAKTGAGLNPDPSMREALSHNVDQAKRVLADFRQVVVVAP